MRINIDPELAMIVGGFVLVAALIGLLFWIEDGSTWQEFAKAHACVKVGEVSGSSSIGYGVTSNGQMGLVSIHTPGKTGYQCNDGVTYWR